MINILLSSEIIINAERRKEKENNQTMPRQNPRGTVKEQKFLKFLQEEYGQLWVLMMLNEPNDGPVSNAQWKNSTNTFI